LIFLNGSPFYPLRYFLSFPILSDIFGYILVTVESLVQWNAGANPGRGHRV